jgi:hypothetical protein
MTEQNISHLSELRLVQIARSGEDDPHLYECAFCREQYDALREMLLGAPQEQRAGTHPGDSSFRLAAQSEADTDEDQRWRQTWYLEDGALVIRVIEETEKQRLTGFCIGDPERYAALRIRFSGLQDVFTPDAQGRFDIGPSSIEIEPMRVDIEDRG